MASDLGRLEEVPVRDVWHNEAAEFTPWLARPENLDLLSSALGLELAVESTESAVGPFRADLVCRDAASDHLVLIENQLERTDHTHLGQLLTYAAGLDAVSVVWISPELLEEHRAALDWLNRMTVPGLRFFGVEVELWRIGDSLSAPRFNLVSRPNEWSRSVRPVNGYDASSAVQYREFWQELAQAADEGRLTIGSPTPYQGNWVEFPGSPERLKLRASVSRKTGRLSAICEVPAELCEPIHDELDAACHELARAVGAKHTNLRSANGTRRWYQIHLRFDFDAKDGWREAQAWLLATADKLCNTVACRLEPEGEATESVGDPME